MLDLQLIENDIHEVEVGRQRVLLHIPTSSLFSLDSVGCAVLDGFRHKTPLNIEQPAVMDTLKEFRKLRIVKSKSEPLPTVTTQWPKQGPGTLVLNVNTGCNLSCHYCYKEDLVSPNMGQKMDLDTARRSVDLLFGENEMRTQVNLVFFGGEPLTNFPLIRATVDYAEKVARIYNKIIDFSLTTNATLLNESMIEYFAKHHFGLSISIDGPKTLHDKNRKTVGGKGTYDIVVKKIHMLLSRYKVRPVGARVTLTRGVTDVVAIFHHLKNELGFAEVGFSPVTAGSVDTLNLTESELEFIYTEMKILGEHYLDAALQDRNLGFSNMNKLMITLAEGARKLIPCGAGVDILAVDKDGNLNLCHRFTGSQIRVLGNISTGLENNVRQQFLEQALDRTGTTCETCQIRNICSGGCYHESYIRYGDPLHPTYHYCDHMREWVDFGIEIYTHIINNNPGFFAKLINYHKPNT